MKVNSQFLFVHKFAICENNFAARRASASFGEDSFSGNVIALPHHFIFTAVSRRQSRYRPAFRSFEGEITFVNVSERSGTVSPFPVPGVTVVTLVSEFRRELDRRDPEKIQFSRKFTSIKEFLRWRPSAATTNDSSTVFRTSTRGATSHGLQKIAQLLSDSLPTSLSSFLRFSQLPLAFQKHSYFPQLLSYTPALASYFPQLLSSLTRATQPRSIPTNPQLNQYPIFHGNSGIWIRR